MFKKLSSRAAPTVLVVLSSLWMFGTILPLCYSVLFPNADIRHIVWALEGRETLSGDVGRLVQQVTSSVGRLERAIPVTAYFSAEYKVRAPRTTKETEVSYLAWFEKRSRPMILVVTRTQIDGSELRFDTDEGSFLRTLRLYMTPALFLTLSVFWFVRTRSSDRKVVDVSDHPSDR